MRTIDWEKELNPEQYKAVMHDFGPLLILAGAGSGKTRTMTYRVARLISEGVDPGSILLVTFTNKAAKEMLARARALTDMPLDEMYAGTFHHLANRFLKNHGTLLGLGENFTIWDEDKSRQEIDIAVAEVAGAKNDPDKTEKLPKGRAIMEALSYVANTSMTLDRAIEEKFPHLSKHKMLIAAAGREYQIRMKRSNALDFDALLLGWRKLLREHPDVRAEYAKKFEHVLVDEFQDTNKIQMDIVAMLSDRHKNLMVVGDDYQSIYSFRGADYDHIMQFPDKYPEAKVCYLVTNYRSTPEIVSLANASIGNNEEQFDKTLKSGREGGCRPMLANAFNQNAQADMVCGEIGAMIARGERLDETAVLYRAHFHAMELQMELTRRRIPFKIVSGIGFFKQAHILDAIAYLSLIHNPQDEGSLIRALKKLQGVGLATAGRISQGIRDAEDPLAALHTFPNPSVSQNGRDQLNRFRDTMAGMARAARNGEPLGRLTEILLDRGYEEHLKLNYDNADSRITDIREMGRMANDYSDLGSFLAEIVLARDAEEAASEKEAKGKVLLSTIHQAKGLEWKNVFLIGVAENLFPLGRVVREEGDRGLEEERRLFYVAVTRAKDRLYIVCPQNDGKNGAIFGKSRFIEELPTQLYAKMAAKKKEGEEIYPLDVPFIEKEEAKAKGARWDSAGRFWYVPVGTDPRRFLKWMPVSVAKKLRKAAA